MPKQKSTISELADRYGALIPLIDDRRVIFGPLFESISYCERHGSPAWSITEWDFGFRLNVGPFEAMTFKWFLLKEREGSLKSNRSAVALRLLVAGDDCVEKVVPSDYSKVDPARYQIGEPCWAYAGNFRTAHDGSPDPARIEVQAHFERLRENHHAYLNRAFHTSTGKLLHKTSYTRFNNPAIYEYAKSVMKGEQVSREPDQTAIATIDQAFREDVLRALNDEPKNRAARLALADPVPIRIEITTVAYRRNPDVVAEVLLRASGTCETCKNKAPFLRSSDGTPYLEVHHKVQLSSGGHDTVANAIAICPNCHRRAHFGSEIPDQF